MFSQEISDNGIPASAAVSTIPRIDCKPDEIIIGNKLKWLNCFIEIPNADVSQINLSTVKLSVIGKTGSVYADRIFFHLDDYDLDGIQDLQVRFNNTEVNNTFFSSVTNTTLFTLSIDGLVYTLPFFDTDSLFLVKSGDFDFARFVQVNSTLPNKGTIIKLDEIDLTKFVPKIINFNGAFTNIGDPKILGHSSLNIRGTVEEKLLFIFKRKVPVLITAIFKDYDNCFLDKNIKRMHCEGNGVLAIRNERTGNITRVELPNLIFEIKNGKATVEGGMFWNDIVNVNNMPMKIRIK
jgi:hypothetical protein